MAFKVELSGRFDFKRIHGKKNPSSFITFVLPWFFAFAEPDSVELFGEKFPKLDGMSTGEWWEKAKPVDTSAKKEGQTTKTHY